MAAQTLTTVDWVNFGSPAASFLYGQAVEELKKSELDHHDQKSLVTIWIRAQQTEELSL
jgi:hypothetical protein